MNTNRDPIYRRPVILARITDFKTTDLKVKSNSRGRYAKAASSLGTFWMHLLEVDKIIVSCKASPLGRNDNR